MDDYLDNFTCSTDSQNIVSLVLAIGFTLPIWIALYLLLFVRCLHPIKLRKLRNLVKKLDFRMEIGFQKLESNEKVVDNTEGENKSEISLNSGYLSTYPIAYRHSKTTAGISLALLTGRWLRHNNNNSNHHFWRMGCSYLFVKSSAKHHHHPRYFLLEHQLYRQFLYRLSINQSEYQLHPSSN